MHYRAHPRHYRAEYVRGYQHRQADVYSLPGWLLRLFLMKYPLSRIDGSQNLKSQNLRISESQITESQLEKSVSHFSNISKTLF